MVVIDREGMGGTLTLGEGVIVDESVSIDISADVTILDGAAVSEDVRIFTHDHRPEDITSKWASPLTIGKGAWICACVIILASCDSIGEGSVVGAGSVVTRSIPPRELWAGNPARYVRTLGE